ncbi:hypothetical protein [Actinoplanes sp. NPDC051851]|uniref:hypothetical protein n=1 Tax=Actinoplanes sp. NPDC051851 TaxID=3154753 RepID=UPI00342D17DA
MTISALGPELLHRAARTYDLVVHLPIEFPLPGPAKPISERFRELSDALLLRTLATAGIPFHIVTGTLESRIAALSARVEGLQSAF